MPVSWDSCFCASALTENASVLASREYHMGARGNQAAADNVYRCSANREICIPIPFLQFCDRKEVTLFKWALPSKTWRILDICTPPIDNTPPLPGNVSAAWQPFEILQVTQTAQVKAGHQAELAC